MTDRELKREVLIERLRKLRAQRREREQLAWEQRLDDALTRRGYARGMVAPRGRLR